MKYKSYMITKNNQYELCFETLSNEVRIQILKKLSEKPRSVTELVKEVGVEQSRLSHSLKMLRICNYVDVEKVGKQRIYSIKEDVLKKKEGNLFEVIDNHIQNYCHNNCAKIKGVNAQ